jgi:hypothetical protein
MAEGATSCPLLVLGFRRFHLQQKGAFKTTLETLSRETCDLTSGTNRPTEAAPDRLPGSAKSAISVEGWMGSGEPASPRRFAP